MRCPRPPRAVVSTCEAGRVRAVLGAAALAAVTVLSGACSSATQTTAPGSSLAPATTAGTTIGTVGTSGTTYPAGRCISRMPGEVLTAEEAVVRFSRTQVCPGYVTIVPGTPVTFQNDDTAPHTVTITEGTAPGGKTVANTTIEPGTTWSRPYNVAGVFQFVTDAIPSFRGTIEVVGGTMQH